MESFNSIFQLWLNVKFLKISGGSRNDALAMYIHLKSPKSCDTVPLSQLTRAVLLGTRSFWHRLDVWLTRMVVRRLIQIVWEFTDGSLCSSTYPGEGRENGCPSQPFVPWFLIIGGSLIMCGLFCREILKRVGFFCNDDIWLLLSFLHYRNCNDIYFRLVSAFFTCEYHNQSTSCDLF